jgi:hypothetical protein
VRPDILDSGLVETRESDRCDATDCGLVELLLPGRVAISKSRWSHVVVIAFDFISRPCPKVSGIYRAFRLKLLISPLDGSLFGGEDVEPPGQPDRAAVHTNTSIQGLYFHPELRIFPELAISLLKDIEETKCFPPCANQVMLFGRTTVSPMGTPSSGLPLFIDRLIDELALVCRPHIPEYVQDMLFPKYGDNRSRQVILNRYQPGDGISPHVDLLKRYDDGIIGISLGSGCAMDFARVGSEEDANNSESKEDISLWLPENSVIILVNEARYNWTHGIRYVHGDVVENQQTGEPEWIPRGFRTSITLRWLLPGADVVGSSLE